MPRFQLLVFSLLISLAATAAWNRWPMTTRESDAVGARPSRFVRIEGGGSVDEANVRTARETLPHSTTTPVWTNAFGFERDVFTFARLVFLSGPGSRPVRGIGPRLGWWVDYPDADLNLSWRLQQLTAIRTDPDARVVRLDDPDLHDYPLLYLEHAGYMELSGDEVRRLRAYLACGGALFVNDFWNQREWDGFADAMERVMPGRVWEELPDRHALFHGVFDLPGAMHAWRVPTMQFWNEAFDPEDPVSPPHRVDRGEGSERMSVRVLRDERGHVVAIAIHNSDVSDGWEREGESDFYFDRFSERVAYPLAINILIYLMTH